MMRRRAWLLAGMAGAASPAWPLAPRALSFPRDFGSHPGLRTEWWYATGWARSSGRDFGFQLTFFRSRVDATQAMASAFAARQLIFAHAAVTDVQGRRLWHDQRIARAGFGVAEAGADDTALRLRDWSLVREDAGGHSHYAAHLAAQDFTLDLRLRATQPVLLQGDAGLSRKGPEAAQASHYYSEPQLRASGSITLQGRRWRLEAGTAWLDHEWSEALLHPDAVGWDWIGMNLFGGGALTAFRVRRRDGSALWTGGSWRDAGQPQASRFPDGSVAFVPQRHWQSPASNARYPVAWTLDTPRGRYRVQAMLDDQELDSRSSTGAIYWEGLSLLQDADGRDIGRGYLEMTGYTAALRL